MDSGVGLQELEMPALREGQGLIVFDAECVFCSRSMRLLVRLDRRGRFRLTPAQSPIGQALYRQAGLPTERFETNLVVIGGRTYRKSDTILAMARALPWPARAALVLKLVPRPLRDAAYDFVARNRYRIWGRTSSCGLASPEMRKRLI